MNKRLLLMTALMVAAIGLVVGGTLWSKGLFSPDMDQAIAEDYRYREIPCWFAIPALAEVRCGELQTPATDGGFILPVVRLIHSSASSPSDPVIYLQGGPGASARLDAEGIQYWLYWRDYADLGRDLILMDPRGVGRSRPQLFCAAYEDFSLRVLKQDISLSEELRQGFTIVRHCFSSFSERGIAIDKISTEASVRDLQALMRLLTEAYPHYQSWNLLGVSYGSRVALLSAAQFPLVRSLILDSAYPPGRGGGQEWPVMLDQAFQRFARWCDAQVECRLSDQQPLLTGLIRALQKLKTQPLVLLIRRWDGEAPLNVVVNDHRFLSAAFSALYDRMDWPKIAPAIEVVIQSDPAQSDHAKLTSLIEPFINHALSAHFSSLTFMAVDCQDHPVQSEAEYQQTVENLPLFAEYTRDLWRYQSCHLLPAGAGQMVTRALPVQPTLLLSGGLDPITPLEWAEDLHGRLPNSQWWIKKELGHAVINSDACVHRSLRRFLDAPLQLFSLGEC